MARKPKDLSHTARCPDCGAWNEYPGGILGTPLVIWHDADCPNRPSGDKGKDEDA